MTPSIHQGLWVGLLAGALLATTTGCAPGPGTTPSPSPSPTWVERDTADDVTLTPPAGWRLAGSGEAALNPAMDLRVIPETGQEGWAGIVVKNYSNFVVRDGGPDRGDAPLDPENGRIVAIDHWTRQGATTELLPDRTIDGQRTVGFRAHNVPMREGGIYTLEQWILRRPDGQWLLYIYSSPGADHVDPALSAALDTLRWTTPTPTPSPSR